VEVRGWRKQKGHSYINSSNFSKTTLIHRIQGRSQALQRSPCLFPTCEPTSDLHLVCVPFIGSPSRFPLRSTAYARHTAGSVPSTTSSETKETPLPSSQELKGFMGKQAEAKGMCACRQSWLRSREQFVRACRLPLHTYLHCCMRSGKV
jgi:hypothetical protein